ncbi:unnamed protein product [Auanema sp. JU1783]|nr:unnamed protein product [Auanema sp. JU1783]
MSTRTRRSAGGEAPTLNPTMIQLLDVGRLRKELEIRGLPTNGARQILADRLSDAVLLGKSIEEPAVVVSPQPKRAIKKTPIKPEEPEAEVVTSIEPVEDVKTIVKSEPIEDSPKPKKKRSLQASSKVSSSKKRKVEKVKSEDRPESEEDVPLLSALPTSAQSSKKDTCSNEVAGPSTDSDDDIPLLSQLPSSNKSDETSAAGHKHGTRSKNLFSPSREKVLPSKKVTEEVRLLCSDDFVESPPESPGYHRSPIPGSLEKGDTDWKPELKKKKDRRHSISSNDRIVKIEKRPHEKERDRERDRERDKVKLIRPPERRTVADEWAKLMAERSKQKTSQISPGVTQIKTEAAEPEKESKPVEKRNEEKKVPRPQQIKKSASSNDTDLLGSIMVDQTHLLGEKKRKIEEAEKEHERILELRNAASSLGKAPIITSVDPNSAKRKPSDPMLILPPPPPPPKKILMVPVPAPSLIIPPPPPPPKKLDSPSHVSRVLLPPPPAPPKVLPVTNSSSKLIPPPPPKGPLPEHIKLEKEKVKASLVDKNSTSGDSKSIPSLPKPIEAPVNNENSLVVGVTQALLLLIQENKKKDEMLRADVHECLNDIIQCVVEIEKHSCSSVSTHSDSVKAEAGEEEEYDPLEASIINSFAEYVPSMVTGREDNLALYSPCSSRSSSEEEEYIDHDDEEDSNDEASDEEEDMDISTKIPSKARQLRTELKLVEPDTDPSQSDGSGGVDLMMNPRDLLMKAKNVLESLNKPKSCEKEVSGPHYTQIPLEEEYEPEEPEKRAPEYHGEPVPSDDDEMLFEIAAGISKPKKKREVVIEEEKLPSDETIEPDYYNADLHIKQATDKNWLIEPENADGLALMWGGVKSNYGIRLPFRDVRNSDEDMETNSSSGSIIAFQVKIIEFLSTKHLPFEELDPHDIRVGFSLRDAANILGESPNSYCITSLGKKAESNEFTDYGKAFHLNDIVTACIDLSTGNISYWINDEFMGDAFKNIPLPIDNAIYPHISVKNCSVAVNFGDFPGGTNEWKENSLWRFPSSLGRGDLERSPKAPESKSECTVLIMVGLPGVGKTTWVRQYLRDHPTEQWTVIQSENVLSAMKINGVSRRRAHHGRWDMVMGLIGKSLQRSVLLAARRRRNYIIDMSNTSRDVRKKRLQLFEEFRRKCVIIIPSDDDMLDRQARQARHDGTAIMPPEAMLEMKALMSIPAPDAEPLDEVYFIEPPIARIQDAIDLVARYNEEARPWVQKKHRRRRAQNIGLGGEKDQSSVSQRKFTVTQPLTVLPPLRVSITPLDDSISPALRSAGSVGSSGMPTGGVGGALLTSPASIASAAYDQKHSASNTPTPTPTAVTPSATGGLQSFHVPVHSELSSPVTISAPGIHMICQANTTMPQVSQAPPGLSIVINTPPPVLSGQTTPGLPVGVGQTTPGIPLMHTPPNLSSVCPSGSGMSVASVTNSFSVPPPSLPTNNQRPLIRLKIEDLPPANVVHSSPVQPIPPVFDPEDVIDLDEEEMRDLRESSKAKASSPMVAEAIMRAKLTRLQMKRREKAAMSGK